MTVPVVIFAGGEGRRIGGGKPHRIIGGKSLLDRAAEMAEQWSDQIVVAVRDEAQLGHSSLPYIPDEAAIEGPLAGLVAALRFGREHAESVLTLPADMPFLPPDLLERLREGLGGSSAAIASSGGYLHPVCGLWRASSLDAVPDYLASGHRSLRGFADAVGFVVVDWPAEPLDPFFNINSPEDLTTAERLLRG